MYDELKRDLANYHWMVKEIQRIECQLENGIINKAILERKLARLADLKKKTFRIDEAAVRITEPKDRTLLEYILEGERPTKIARFIQVTRTTFYDRRNKIIEKMIKGVV